MNKIFFWASKQKKRIMGEGNAGSQKKEGYILIVTFLISSLILTVGLGLAKILATEIEFSADLLFAEKSYFAAESGIEKALLAFKKEPVQNIQEENVLLVTEDTESAEFDLNTGNLVSEFSFSLQPSENVQFRLKKDTNITSNTNIELVDNFLITPYPSDAEFKWKIQCRTKDGTMSLVNFWSGRVPKSFINLLGQYDKKAGIYKMEDFLGFIPDEQKSSCFFTVENTTDKELIIDISKGEMPPATAIIRSEGHIGNRKKIITFDYAQKKLESFFSFGLLNRR